MPFNMHVNATRVLTEHVSPAFLCAVVRLLVERRRRDLLLRLAKLRSGDTTCWNLPPPSTPSSCSSSCLSSEEPNTRSKAPCKERRTLPTQPATCSWAAESFPPKYCMVKKTHTGGFRGTGVTMGTHSLEKLFSFVSAEGILCVRQKAGSLFSFSGGEQNNYSFV